MKKSSVKNSGISKILTLIVLLGVGYLLYSRGVFFNSAKEKKIGNTLIVYTRDDQAKAVAEVANNASIAFKAKFEARNLTSENLGTFVKLKDCETQDNSFDLGIVDPFVYGCFKAKDQNYEVILSQKDCSISTFVIVPKDSTLAGFNDLNDKNVLMLGQARVSILAGQEFSLGQSVRLNKVIMSTNLDLAYSELRNKTMDAIYVVGFKKESIYTIPLMNIGSTAAFEKESPYKLISQKDYGIPCNLLVANKKAGLDLNDKNKKTFIELVEKISGIDGESFFLEFREFSKISDNVLKITKDSLKSLDINANEVIHKRKKLDKN